MVSIITSLNTYVQSILTKTNYRRNAIKSILAFAVLVLGGLTQVSAQNAPVITCPGAETITLPMSADITIDQAFILDAVDGFGVTATDADTDPLTYTADFTSLSCTDIAGGAFDVMVTVSDDEMPAQTANCTISVTVTETDAPTAVCNDITVYLDGTGNYSLTTADEATLIAGSSDLCGIVDTTFDVSTFDCMDIGAAVAVTATVEDAAGNSTSCMTASMVTVLDTMRPLQYPSIAVNNDLNLCEATVSWPSELADNCGGPYGATLLTATDPRGVDILSSIASTTVMGVPSFLGDFPVGTSTITYTATDGNTVPNTVTGTFTITVVDNEAPTLTCPPGITVDFADCNAGDALLPDLRSQVTVDDNCTGYAVTQSPAPGTNLSSITTVEDGESFAITITVTDDQANNLTDNCNVIVSLNQVDAPSPATAGASLPAESSDCGPLAVSAPIALDACGNVICGVPAFTPPGTSVSGVCSGTIGACTSTTYSSASGLGLAIPDGSGSVSNSITVAGSNPIVNDVNVSFEILHEWVGDLRVVLISPSGTRVRMVARPGVPASTFGCGEDNINVTIDDDLGLSTVESECDPSFGSSTYAIEGIFQSQIPLSLVEGENPNGNWTLQVFDLEAVFSGTLESWSIDICAEAPTLVSSPTYTFPVGTHNITWNYDDGNGNTSSQTQLITVLDDTEAPTFTCQDVTVQLDASGNASISVDDVFATGLFPTDNCTDSLDINISLSSTSFDCDDIGDNFLNVFVSDDYFPSNSTNCFITVVVEDNVDPTLFNIPAAVSGVDCNSIPDLPVVRTDDNVYGVDTVYAADACGINDIIFNEVSTQSSDLNTCAAYDYTITRSWTALDNNGNTEIMTQTITVEDNDAPTGFTFSSNLPSNDIINTDATTCSAFVSLSLDDSDDYDCAAFDNLTVEYFSPLNGFWVTGADASGVFNRGTHTVFFRVTDPCGNVMSSPLPSKTFTVVDQVAPTASCVGSLNLGLSSSGILVVQPPVINNGSFDNCDFINAFNPSQAIVSPDTLRCEDVGTSTIVTLTVTDFSGNSSSCTTTINLQENNAPTVIGVDTTLVLGAGNTASISPESVDGGTFDDCTDVTLSLSKSVFTDADLGMNTISLIAMDENGNVDSTDVIVTVTLPPTCFNIPADLSGGAGDIVSIPITAEDFTSLVGFQFELFLEDSTVGEFVGISGVDPLLNNVIIGEALQTDSFIVQVDTVSVDTMIDMTDPMMPDTTYTFNTDTTFAPQFDAIAVTWAQGNSDPMSGELVPLTFDDSDILFYIDLMLTGNIGDNSDLEINASSTTTPSEVVYSFGNNLYGVAFTPCPASSGFVQIGQLVFSGQVYTEDLTPVALTEVYLVDQTVLTGPGNEADTTEVDGLYSLTTTGVDEFEIQPEKDINWPNGIDILDVGLIQRHTVGNPYVGSAYKKIAADVSGNGDITTFDAVLLNAFLASFFDPTATPPTESWQFVDAKQMLANDPNAFVPNFKNFIELNGITSDSMGNDFIAVKTGDLGGLQTADVTALTTDDEGVVVSTSRSDDQLTFMIQDRSIQEGETVNLELTAENFEELMAYQWILKFDPQQLQYKGASEIQEGSFTFSEAKIDEGQLILTWFAANDVTVSEKDVVFSLQFEALNKVSSLANTFEVVTYDQFKAVAYQGNQTAMDVELMITESNANAGAFTLNQNIPNPFKDETVISFNLPESGEATLSIMDVTGRVLKVYQGDFTQGYNEVSVNRSELPQAGTLFYELKTSEHTASKKMIIID